MFNTDVGFATLIKDREWEVLEVSLDQYVVELASNETCYIKDTEDYALGKDMELLVNGDVRIMRISGSVILCSITDKAFIVVEGYV